ncbi:hypothetical protein O9G_003911 [Rozella allomycis CSF55]|uniref:CUE domain-containing protein n=1 Tax=Rozella allomycis (strain CSF55) TaxID=988480 RepID=A0A075AT17_ROZAC|nr:hypothetical protein O9G_003911 [Rozella allomycis CSF55]|eukprot:EPZ33408.1 hypothetical protein O9G_003911 [Rozella allomycis CSF55]
MIDFIPVEEFLNEDWSQTYLELAINYVKTSDNIDEFLTEMNQKNSSNSLCIILDKAVYERVITDRISLLKTELLCDFLVWYVSPLMLDLDEAYDMDYLMALQEKALAQKDFIISKTVEGMSSKDQREYCLRLMVAILFLYQCEDINALEPFKLSNIIRIHHEGTMNEKLYCVCALNNKSCSESFVQWMNELCSEIEKTNYVAFKNAPLIVDLFALYSDLPEKLRKFYCSEDANKDMIDYFLNAATQVDLGSWKNVTCGIDEVENGFLEMNINEEAKTPVLNPAGDDLILMEKISEITEIFPDLGDGFVEKCLEAYNWNSSVVIDKLLTNTLDQHLDQLDRNLQRTLKMNHQKKEGLFGEIDDSVKHSVLKFAFEEEQNEQTDNDVNTHSFDEVEMKALAAYNANGNIFHRNFRKTKERENLKSQLGWTDEQIEGWATMLNRNPRKDDILQEAKIKQFSAERKTQKENKEENQTKETSNDGGGRGRGRGRGRGSSRGRRAQSFKKRNPYQFD